MATGALPAFKQFVTSSAPFKALADAAPSCVELYFEQSHELILVADDGGDCKFYLDTSRLHDGECPVVVLGPGRDGVEVAPSFEAFAVRWLERDLTY